MAALQQCRPTADSVRDNLNAIVQARSFLLDNYFRSIRDMIGKTEISTPGARILILNGADQVLLEERSDFKKWGLPGGSADPGEDIIGAAKREAYEETGLNIRNLVPLDFLPLLILNVLNFLTAIDFILLICCSSPTTIQGI